MINSAYGGLDAAFWGARPLIGMVHLPPLPGSPRDTGHGMEAILKRALADTRALEAGGADAIMVENFFDSPFEAGALPPHTIAALTVAVSAVRAATTLPIGVNALRNDAESAIAIAHVCKAQFVRINVYVGAAVTDSGVIQAAARRALLYRKMLHADVALMADIFVKHASQLGDVSLADTAKDAVERGLADALIVSGTATGAATDPNDLQTVREALPGCPLLVGSGFSIANSAALLENADGAIVGTALKRDGIASNEVDEKRVRDMKAAALRAARRS